MKLVNYIIFISILFNKKYIIFNKNTVHRIYVMYRMFFFCCKNIVFLLNFIVEHVVPLLNSLLLHVVRDSTSKLSLHPYLILKKKRKEADVFKTVVRNVVLQLYITLHIFMRIFRIIIWLDGCFTLFLLGVLKKAYFHSTIWLIIIVEYNKVLAYHVVAS